MKPSSDCFLIGYQGVPGPPAISKLTHENGQRSLVLPDFGHELFIGSQVVPMSQYVVHRMVEQDLGPVKVSNIKDFVDVVFVHIVANGFFTMMLENWNVILASNVKHFVVELSLVIQGSIINELYEASDGALFIFITKRDLEKILIRNNDENSKFEMITLTVLRADSEKFPPNIAAKTGD